MMTVAVVALAIALAGALGLIAWLVYRVFADARALADERQDRVATQGRLERVGFELDTTKAALTKAERDRDIFEEAANAAPSPVLPAGDVDGRLLQAAQADAAARDVAVPAKPAAGVRSTAATKPAAAARVPPGKLDPNEPLL